ncbi:hypothetical protein RFI_26730 [Reticulomyxa filosa]|uniref:Uncharacterized protein n=1 Tax=Reticulomyxa filosa TaxID=46433 RepID=X6MAZ9_RETFI|nr:hypothetical protein RFI_26730 [Reticulomyxa filosa]|eukprot:ETO10647.1 hypothetical protein RFI_26730 [Reticulomyxa filosa]
MKSSFVTVIHFIYLKININLSVRIQTAMNHFVINFISPINDNINDNEVNKSKKLKKLNNYNSMNSFCAVIGGSNNNLKWNTSDKNHEKKENEMLLFCRYIRLLIKYDEDNNTLQFHDLFVGHTIADLFQFVSMMPSGSLVGGMLSVYVRLLFQNY